MTKRNSFWFLKIRGSFPYQWKPLESDCWNNLIGWAGHQRKFNLYWFPNFVCHTEYSSASLFYITIWLQNPVHPLWHILFLACTYPWGPLLANTLSINYPEGGSRRIHWNKLCIFLFPKVLHFGACLASWLT